MTWAILLVAIVVLCGLLWRSARRRRPRPSVRWREARHIQIEEDPEDSAEGKGQG